MAKSFREMVAWQLAFELEQKVVALIAASPEAKRDFDFRDQLRDACKSVPSNIAEGYDRWLRGGVASGYFAAESVGPLIRLAARCRTAMTRWQSYLRRAKNDPRFNARKKRPSP